MDFDIKNLCQVAYQVKQEIWSTNTTKYFVSTKARKNEIQNFKNMISPIAKSMLTCY